MGRNDMKCSLTTQEKLRDLRAKLGYKLQQVEMESGISSSTISNYENDETKDFQVGTLRTLANYYHVSLGYLLGLTDNLTENGTPIDELHLDDETIRILKSGKLNNRLLCEMIKHPDFPNLMCDMEIYVDNHAGTMIHEVNRYVTGLRRLIMEKAEVSADDIYMKTFEKSVIDDDAYFGNLLEGSIKNIARDIREDHKKDWDTGDEEHITDKYLDSIKELWTQVNSSDNHTANNTDYFPHDGGEDKLSQVDMAQVITWGKKLDINFSKLTPEETRELTRLISKGSRNPLIHQPSKGRGKKK